MNYKEMDDEKLANYLRSKSDDREGWDVLLERADSYLQDVIQAKVPKEDRDYDDLCNEIQESTRKIVCDSEIQNFKGLVQTIAWKRADKWHRDENYGRRRREQLGEESERIIDNAVDNHWTPEQEVTRTESADQVKRGFQQLKPQERQVLLRHYVLRQSHKEIAREMKIRQTHSRKLGFQARKSLMGFFFRLGMTSSEVKEGLRKLDEEGEIDEMLNC